MTDRAARTITEHFLGVGISTVIPALMRNGSTTMRCCAKEDHLQMNNGVISKVDGGTIHG